MDEDFDILAAKVLAGEAAAEEQARLDELLSQNAEFEREFNELQESWNTIRELGTLADALEAPPASIPPERLSQLQELVRTKFKRVRSDTIETAARGGVIPALETRGTPTTRQPQPAQLESADGGVAPLAGIKKWLRERIRLSPLSASIGLVALALLVGVILFFRRSAEPQSAGTGSDPFVAYLVPLQGEPEVRRHAKPIALGAATPLRGADEVRLPIGTTAYLVTAAGAAELVGPKRMLAGEEAASDRASTDKAGTGQRAFANTTNALQVALFQPAKEISAPGLLATTRGSQSIPLYSPLGSTANLKPLILWKSEPGKTYDVAITDEFDSKATPLRLSGIVPPVEFAKVEAWQGRTLATDGLYRITLSETGKPLSVCEYTFRTLKDADASIVTAPGQKLLHAYRILSTEPSQVGDALAELLTLPAVFAESELALRLKLYLFGKQGYREDFDAVAAQLLSGDPGQ